MMLRLSGCSFIVWVVRRRICVNLIGHWWCVIYIKRKDVTMLLLWQEYRAAHPNGYGYTWFYERFRAHQKRTHVRVWPSGRAEL